MNNKVIVDRIANARIIESHPSYSTSDHPQQPFTMSFPILKSAVMNDGYDSESTVAVVPCGRPLHFLEGELFGRDAEASALIEAYERQIFATDRELALLTGASGTGKTRLAQVLRDHVEKNGGMMITGKFDQLQSPKPFSAFVMAFTDFSNQIMQKGDDTVVWVRNMVLAGDSIDTKLLIGMIPALATILKESSRDSYNQEPTQLLPDLQRQRFLNVFAEFLSVICTREYPCVVFLDDLQWADVGSLALLNKLVSKSQNNQGSMILGACRGNEVQIDDPLAEMLRSLEDTSDVRITNIMLRNLSQESVKIFLALSLDRNEAICETLSGIVYKITNGNIFFTKQYVQSLHADGIIFFDETNKQWTWNEDRLQKSSWTNTELLYRTWHDLAPEHQDLLKVASSLGGVSTTETLCLLLPQFIVETGLQKAISRGILVPITGTSKHDSYRFAHDQLQQAAYDLIPIKEKKEFHLWIARELADRFTEEKLSENLYLIVGQFAFGHELIDAKEEREKVGTLCLKAGQKAIAASAFHTGSSYFTLGIKVLGERCWRDHYVLCLLLHNAAAEICYCNADLVEMEARLNAIFRHARSYGDKVIAYSTKILSLGGYMKLHEAIDLGLVVMEKLGEPLPSATKYNIFREYFKTKWLLRGKSNNDILNQSEMRDDEKLGAMRILNVIFAYAFFARPEYIAILATKGVQLTMEYGLSASSAPLFAAYAVVLCSSISTMEDGYRFGKFSLQILEKFKINAWIPRVNTFMYSLVAFWRDPIQGCIQPLYDGYKIGLVTGDIEFAYMSVAMYSFMTLFAGKPLPKFLEEMKTFLENMLTCNQESVVALFISLVQMCSNLLGNSPDPLVLTGEFMNEEEKLKSIRESKNGTAETNVYLSIAWLALYMGNFKLGEKYGVMTRNAAVTMQYSIGRINQYFLDGMAAVMAARATGMRKKRLQTVRHSVKQLRRVAKGAPFNFLHYVCLLEAEMAALKGNVDNAKLSYRESINLAVKENYLHHLGMSYDRLAYTLRKHGEHREAIQCYVKARDAYMEWGAKIVVDQLTQTITEYSLSCIDDNI